MKGIGLPSADGGMARTWSISGPIDANANSHTAPSPRATQSAPIENLAAVVLIRIDRRAYDERAAAPAAERGGQEAATRGCQLRSHGARRRNASQ